MNHFEEAQLEERSWWGTCSNTLGEELKQVIYAHQMGLTFQEIDGRPYVLDLEGKVVVDIGGGPSSLLLKAINGKCIVIDPCNYPEWVSERYWYSNIEYIKQLAEDASESVIGTADEVWIYNCLQHVRDPEEIIRKAKLAKKIRIFEWIDSEVNTAHPHQLTKEKLDEWLGTEGKVEKFTGINGCYGTAYYSIIDNAKV